MLVINHQKKPAEVNAEKRPQTMEVTLSAAPKPKPTAAQNPSPAAPAQPTPPPTPKPVQAPKPIAQPKLKPTHEEATPKREPIRKSIPKPTVPRRPEPPTEETLPKPPKLRRPIVKPKPEMEPLPEFKDDFASLSKDYSRKTPEPRGANSLGDSPAQPSDNGIHPGSIVNINPRIHYPLQAQRQGLQGVVVVLIHIAPDGTTNGVDLLHSSGYEVLDNEVLGAVQHWRFKPPMRGNTPVEGVYKHRVIFGVDEVVTDDFETHWREIELQPAEKSPRK